MFLALIIPIHTKSSIDNSFDRFYKMVLEIEE